MDCPICKQDLIIIDKEEKTLEDNQAKVNKYALCKSCNKQWKLNKTKTTPKNEEKQIKIVGEDESAPPLDVSKLAKLLMNSKEKKTREVEVTPTVSDPFWDTFKGVEYDPESDNEHPSPKHKTESGEDTKLDIEEFESKAKSTPRDKGESKAKSTLRDKGESKEKSTPRDKGESKEESIPREESENIAKSAPRRNENVAKSGPRRKGEKKVKSSQRESSENKAKSNPRKRSESIASLSSIEKEENRVKSTSKVKENFGEESGVKAKFALMLEKLTSLKMNVTFIRKILGIFSIVLFVLLFVTGVTSSVLGVAMTSITFSIICLGTGVYQLFTQKNRDLFSFVFPPILYFIGGIIASLQSGNSVFLLIGAIIALFITVFLVLLAIFAKMEKA